MAKVKPAHYVDNKVFTKALSEYADACREATAAGEPLPVMSNYIGECVIKMANRLASSPRFRNYSYREEMVGNAIIAVVKYAKNFNGAKFNNAFAYVTQILFSHMVQTIKKEKKMYKTNMELISNAQLLAFDDAELQNEANEHARAIADQKLGELEEASRDVKPTFGLKTGYTKEAREAYDGGTPLDEAEPE